MHNMKLHVFHDLYNAVIFKKKWLMFKINNVFLFKYTWLYLILRHVNSLNLKQSQNEGIPSFYLIERFKKQNQSYLSTPSVHEIEVKV